MDRTDITAIISQKLKLVRTEYNYTQEQMAEVIGVSKKTVVQIEKQRIDCGWTVAVTICALFPASSILQNAMGGNPMDLIYLVSNDGVYYKNNTLVNDVLWWRTESANDDWILQQNVIHSYYRLVDSNGYIKSMMHSKEQAMKEFTK
ncbi:helix-turn-helix transcriptional regulator [Kurthia sibirica]|uniref:Transcriptional regulator n=1 Tax=Kurthia sibirica TaxID=202750 RepID=A0A2U3AQ58_9BACL|nr:helix-turn-helix domain-containing protein [Kurthia sibirica]PWI26673.1 transcriptional regulator [Kurthia sibirica]GEK32939.1 transcriptional regulator [Kurthia sibirica]